MAAHKHSRKRDAILECVCSAANHPSAEWVYSQLKPQIPDLSLGTVYRNLAFFKEEGIIGSMGIVNGAERFEGNPHPHTHFVCTRCGAVTDLEGIEIPPDLSSRVHCGSVRSCTLTFTGLCTRCAQAGMENKKP